MCYNFSHLSWGYSTQMDSFHLGSFRQLQPKCGWCWRSSEGLSEVTSKTASLLASMVPPPACLEQPRPPWGHLISSGFSKWRLGLSHSMVRTLSMASIKAIHPRERKQKFPILLKAETGNGRASFLPHFTLKVINNSSESWRLRSGFQLWREGVVNACSHL